MLLLNSLFLFLFDQSTALVYMSNVFFHIVLGTLLTIPFAVFIGLHLTKMPIWGNVKAAVAGSMTSFGLISTLVTGWLMVAFGSTLVQGLVLWGHIASVVLAIGGFVLHVSLKRGVRYQFLKWGEGLQANKHAIARHPLTITLGVFGGLSVLFVLYPLLAQSVQQSSAISDSMGASQAKLLHAEFLADEDLSRSETCGQAGCHPDVTAQWAESVHRFSSFNNPYYKASIAALVDRKGEETARWCASCHDPVVLFSGRFGNEQPLDMDHWTAHEGITCLSCHATTGLQDVRGNGRFEIARPDEYPLARATSTLGKEVHNRLVRAKPEPHRQAMLKPMHQTQEFCGTCHKVGIPPEVNDYRWKRGQNDYDAWHRSGASGNTVRSFYLPKEPQTCITCHMPLVPSDDQGNEDGFVRSHRFATANTALPYINEHNRQLEEVQAALQDSIATVDLFYMTVNGRTVDAADPMPVLNAGDAIEMHIVVRNRKVGHGFPAGTNDSNELWLQLNARDEAGNLVMVSGSVAEDGQIDTTAHHWGTVQVDKESQRIDKRNAHDWRTTVYTNVIGPGTAHTVRYAFRVPSNATIHTFDIALLHRKFKWYFNEWTFRGEVEGDPAPMRSVDTRSWTFNDNEAPDIPITKVTSIQRNEGASAPSGRPMWERWNDYGIGLLLQGDTRGAQQAFIKVTELASASAEGPINLARIHLAEGQITRAREALELADQRQPDYLKTRYFWGEVHKAEANYDAALDAWMVVYEAYPLDRLLLLNIGRVHYLLGDYQTAYNWFEAVLEIDPEDLGALYNRMLVLGALGDEEGYQEAQAIYTFHKEDEDAMALTRLFKQQNPVENNEAQPIHTHAMIPVRR